MSIRSVWLLSGSSVSLVDLLFLFCLVFLFLSFRCQIKHSFLTKVFPHYLQKKMELHSMPYQCLHKLGKEKERSHRRTINVENKCGSFCLNGRNFSHDTDLVSLSLLSLSKGLQCYIISNYSFISYNTLF